MCHGGLSNSVIFYTDSVKESSHFFLLLLLALGGRFSRLFCGRFLGLSLGVGRLSASVGFHLTFDLAFGPDFHLRLGLANGPWRRGLGSLGPAGQDLGDT